MIYAILVWTHSKSLMSFLCWGPTDRCSILDGISQGQSKRAGSSSSPCWPSCFGCDPGSHWSSGFWEPIDISCYLPTPPSASPWGCSQSILTQLSLYLLLGCLDPGAGLALHFVELYGVGMGPRVKPVRMAFLSSSKWNALHRLMFLENLMRVWSFPLPMLPVRMLNNVSPNTPSRQHHSSLVFTWTTGNWPQHWVWSVSQFLIHWVVHLSDPCLSSLKTRISLNALHNNTWMTPIITLCPVQSTHFSRHISMTNSCAHSWRGSRYSSVAFVFSVC